MFNCFSTNWSIKKVSSKKRFVLESSSRAVDYEKSLTAVSVGPTDDRYYLAYILYNLNLALLELAP